MAVSGLLIAAEKCPSCGKYSAFPTQRHIKINVEGEESSVGIMSMECHKCEWQSSLEEDLEVNKMLINDAKELIRMVRKRKEVKKHG